MAVIGTAQKVGEAGAESISSGVRLYEAEVIYQVITDTRTDGLGVVLSAAGLPAIGSVYEVGLNNLFCYSRIPQRVDSPATERKWHVRCSFSNDSAKYMHDSSGLPVFFPNFAVKKVEVNYVGRDEPIIDAEFKNITVGPFHEASQPSDTNPFEVDPAKIMDNPDWLIATRGPVVNSAGDAKYATRQSANRMVTISDFATSIPEDFDDFKNAINDREVVISQWSGVNELRRMTFPALTLRVADIVAREQWFAGILYFARTLVLEENKRTWVHSELDVGQRMRVFEGQYKPGGGIWTIDELDELTPPIGTDYGLLPITQESVVVGDRGARLNGWGAPLPLASPGSAAQPNDGESVYLNFLVGSIKNFEGLGLASTS
jgi:hypothetical protein